MLSILSNPTSLSANRVLAVSEQAIARAVERLGSGLRINSARDDAAGLAISVRLIARSRQSSVDLRSMNDMVSLLQVADASLATTGENLQRIRELKTTDQLKPRLQNQLVNLPVIHHLDLG